MDVNEIMTEEPITVSKNERVSHVLEIMEKNDVSKLPAVKDDEVVGLVTDGAIADELGSQRSAGMDPSSLHASTVMERDLHKVAPDAALETVIEDFAAEDAPSMFPVVFGEDLVGVVTKADLLPHVDDGTPVRRFMVEDLVTVEPEDRIVHARRKMLDEDVERLPVVEGGKVVGLLAEFDVARGLNRFREEVPSRHQSSRLKEFQVEDAMTRSVVVAEASLPADEAAERMLEEDVGCLPVVSGSGKIQGLVTRSDLIRRI